MPVFHTKTIHSILDPVAQQVSRLMILHEDAEDGNAMPDLERPVHAVSLAVSNLVRVGKETINSCNDPILKQDMPAALVRVEEASKLLEEASALLKADPYSAPARKKLIGGSRGILQGTSALLLCFDESEVRKLLRDCKKVLDYLAVAEVIETMEDLVHFLKDLSPCLSKVSREVSAREKELTHQVHAEILVRCLEQVKTLVPILICSMKIYTHIVSHGGKGAEEAAENRNYLTNRMAEEIHEIMRVLQLTTYDEDQSELDNLTVLKKLSNTIHNKMFFANDWLGDPLALRGGVGEKAVRSILDNALKIADRCLPKDGEHIRKQVGEIQTMTDALCELRMDGRGDTPQAESLARSIKEKLHNLQEACVSAVAQVDKAGLQQIAHTVQGRLEQAKRWLNAPGNNDRGLGKRAIALIVEEGKKVAEGLAGIHKAEILVLCDEVADLSHQLSDLCDRGLGNSPQAQQIARQLSQKLHELKERIQNAVVSRVVEDFIDITTPLKQFTDAVLTPEGVPGRDHNFVDKANNLQQFSNRAVKTAKIVAAGGSGGNKKLAEALLSSSNQVESLTPQLISAGRIRMTYPENNSADEHFENLRQQYADTIMRVRNLCDEATDSADFIKISEEQMKKHTFLCEEAIRNKQPQKMVDNTSSIARLANRVLLVAKQESDNSEDPMFIDSINRETDVLQNAVPIMVQDAKQVAINPSDGGAVSRWRESNQGLLGAVGRIHKVVESNKLPAFPDINNLHLNGIENFNLPKIVHKTKLLGDRSVHFNDSIRKYIIPDDDSSQPQNYNFFTEKVGENLRQVPSPRDNLESISPIPEHTNRTISPLPKWARGDNADLLYQELSANNHDENSSHNLTFQQEQAPPRPPLPQGEAPPVRPPPPETDDEDEVFKKLPHPNQPIMVAAHGLHQEVRQWSSKDNEIVAAAKRMALLMARLSELVQKDSKGSKRELIATAKAIAEASEEVSRLARGLARECTDKRIRTNLLQVCERIPTIGTQLRILSTVKATMLGAQGDQTVPGIPKPGSEEDKEATDMLVGNAQNLMQSVKETVRAAEGASIKIRSDQAGHRLRWVRKQPWYQY